MCEKQQQQQQFTCFYINYMFPSELADILKLGSLTHTPFCIRSSYKNRNPDSC